MFAQILPPVKPLPYFCRNPRAGFANLATSGPTVLDLIPMRSLASGFIAALVIVGLHRLLNQRGARAVGVCRGEIAPHTGLVLAVCAIGLFIAATAFWATFTVPGSFPAPLVGAGALVMTALSGWSLHPVWVIRWNAKCLEGPSATLPAPWSRTAIAWDSITAAGRDSMGNFFVQHWDGTRIRWNFSYGGYGHLVAAVERNCPHLFPEPAATA